MSETPQAERTGTGTAEVPSQTRGATAQPPRDRSATAASGPTGWVGGIVFAATLMIMLGAFSIIVGLTAIFKSGFYVVNSSGLVINVDYSAWGWVHFGLGVVAVAAGIGLLSGQTWARAVGIAMALISAIVNLAFIPAYPLWSIVVIALDVIVIYAIAVHGKELKAGV
jgi:hypothetical protein